MCLLSIKVSIRKKPVNLFNDPRISLWFFMNSFFPFYFEFSSFSVLMIIYLLSNFLMHQSSISQSFFDGLESIRLILQAWSFSFSFSMFQTQRYRIISLDWLIQFTGRNITTCSWVYIAFNVLLCKHVYIDRVLYKSKHTYIGLVVRVFANGQGDMGSISGPVIQKTLKWYLMPPCSSLSNIRYVSRVKWSNLCKGVASSPTPRCSSYWGGSLLVALD